MLIKNAFILFFLIKMGIMSEMMNEAVDAAMDNNELEEETDEEIIKVLNDVLGGIRRNSMKIFFYLILHFLLR